MPKKLYISPLAFDLKSPFGSSEIIFIFMDLLKVDFPTTYNLMKRFMTSIFKKFPEKVPITLCSPLGLSRHFLTCHSHPALLGPALISPLLFQEQESRLCWHPDGETASDLSPDIGEINFLVFLHSLFLI